jgi:hypothetical protein
MIRDSKYFADNNVYEMDAKDFLRDEYTYEDLEFSINNYMGDEDYKRIAMFHDASFVENLMDRETFEVWRDGPDGIASSGQLQPIVIYRDLIADGRNRIRALLSLGIEKVKYRKLKNNLKKSEVLKWVMMNNNRKQLTKTQQAINLYISNKCDKKTKNERKTIGQATGGRVSPSQLERVHSLVSALGGMKDPRFEALRQGSAYRKLDGKLTISLQAIIDDLRIRAQKDVDALVSAGSDPDGHNRTTREYKEMRKILSGILNEYLCDSKKLAVRDAIAETDLFTVAEWEELGETINNMHDYSE